MSKVAKKVTGSERSRGICSSADLSWKCFSTGRSGVERSAVFLLGLTQADEQILNEGHGFSPLRDASSPAQRKLCLRAEFLSAAWSRQLLGGPPRRVSSPRLRPGSTLGLGLGAFLVSRLPLSLLPMKPNITRMTFESEGMHEAGINKSLEFDRNQILNQVLGAGQPGRRRRPKETLEDN